MNYLTPEIREFPRPEAITCSFFHLEPTLGYLASFSAAWSEAWPDADRVRGACCQEDEEGECIEGVGIQAHRPAADHHGECAEGHRDR